MTEFNAEGAVLPVMEFGNATPWDYLLLYLGVSIAMHAFPSTGDANVIWQSVVKAKGNILMKVVAVPVVGLIYAGAIGSMLWLDLLYGVAVCIGLPQLIIGMMG